MTRLVDWPVAVNNTFWETVKDRLPRSTSPIILMVGAINLIKPVNATIPGPRRHARG
ncbi:hypothetical protein SAMN05660662_0169 [Blastococcus aurantiacus]|uniref:Uncharacterized protein n=1 Tax=Blastococcus aurantiacus TaxID=1550231 RepID=A0A1G7R5C2_9ACTN|nr:hypothetical protein SAMN05660662_0169 [Blastococcus aurantiacus]